MKRYNFNQTGGFPLITDVLEDLQYSGDMLEKFAGMCGNFSIISGCEVGQTTVTDGVVLINGELLEFKSSVLQANVIIKEEISTAQFEDGNTKPVKTYRYATFGTATTQYAWSSFKRIPVLSELTARLAAIESNISNLSNSLQALNTSFNNHTANVSNPHTVTKQQVGILKMSSIFLGDINGKNVGWTSQNEEATMTLIARTTGTTGGGDDNYRIAFNSGFTDTNYEVFLTVAYDGNYILNNDITVTVANKTVTGFDISAREFSEDVQNLYLNYLIIKK